MPAGTRGYAVGYGKPPVHTRFAKGRSGNPGGRPRGKNLTTLLQEALAETVTIELGGRRRRLSKGEAIIARLVDGAINADPRSLKLLLPLVLKLEMQGRQDAWDSDEDDDGEDPREWLVREIDRLRHQRTLKNAEALVRLPRRAGLTVEDASPLLPQTEPGTA
jgi:hypothetical protein